MLLLSTEHTGSIGNAANEGVAGGKKALMEEERMGSVISGPQRLLARYQRTSSGDAHSRGTEGILWGKTVSYKDFALITPDILHNLLIIC